MNKESEFFLTSRNFVTNYLQTAVIIDDKLFTKENPESFRGLSAPKRRKSAVKQTEKAKATSKSEKEVEDLHTIVPQDLIRSFAKKSIVCSTYQPEKKSFSTGQNGDFRKLCKAADVAVIDWSMFRDTGQKAIELILGITEDSLSSQPEQLRLIIVYTGELNLFEVEDKIFEKLSKSQRIQPVPESVKNLAIRIGPIRIVVLGKKNGRTRLEKYKNNEVKELELADRVIDEFTQMTAGLVSNIALQALSALRANTRKVISKFSPNLDAAFLNHRILSLPDEDTESHLIDLIADELNAVIEDQFSSRLFQKSDIKNWIERSGKDCLSNLKDLGKINNKPIPSNDFYSLSNYGVDHFNNVEGHPFKRLKKRQAKGQDFRLKMSRVLSGENNYDGDLELAFNMSFRTFYTSLPRVLTLGTLLAESDKKPKNEILDYWIVIQPRCDSVRLKEARNFPLLHCTSISKTDVKSSRDYVIKDKNEFKILSNQFNPFNIETLTFSPSSSKKVKSSFNKSSDNYEFKSNEGRVFRWIAEFKFGHAQRIAQRISDEMSRVGLAESEWLRLFN